MAHVVDYLVVGGGIAGTTAAETIRETDDRGSIAILSAEPHPLYSRVLLPAYVEGKISRDKVFLRSPEQYSKRGIELFSNEEVILADFNRQEVKTRGGNTFFYKNLLIAAGGSVRPWHVEGITDAPVSRLQTIDDADYLRNLLDADPAADTVVVGGGFIGLELINALVPRKHRVHCVYPQSRYWEHCLDEDGSNFLEYHLEKQGVALHRGEKVLAIRKTKEGGSTVFTSRNTSYNAGVIAVGVGIERAFAPFSSKELRINHGIETNKFLETSVEGVWAAGDIAEFYDPILEKPMLIGNWNNAFLQGRTAGHNMAVRHLRKGEKETFSRVSLYAIDVLGLHVAFLGDVYHGNTSSYEAITRFEEHVFYERFFLEHNRIVGAIFMNKFEDQRVIENLIRTRRDVSDMFPYLRNPTVDLREIM